MNCPRKSGAVYFHISFSEVCIHKGSLCSFSKLQTFHRDVRDVSDVSAQMNGPTEMYKCPDESTYWEENAQMNGPSEMYVFGSSTT